MSDERVTRKLVMAGLQHMRGERAQLTGANKNKENQDSKTDNRRMGGLEVKLVKNNVLLQFRNKFDFR